MCIFRYQVWRLTLNDFNHDKVEQIVNNHNLDVWTKSRDWMDVMVSPLQTKVVSTSLTKAGVQKTVYIENVQK